MNATRPFAHSPSIVAAQNAPSARSFTGAGDNSHVMRPYNDASNTGAGNAGELASPFPRKPQASVVKSQMLHQVAAAPSSARATARVLHDRYSSGFAARAAYDRRCYRVGLAAIGFGLLLMLLALLWLGPGWLRSTTPKVTANDAWCSGFRGLSCKQQDTARD